MGFWANTNDVAATEAVVAIEITRLRTKERDSTIIHASKQNLPLRGATRGPTSSVSEYL
ncbi:hypothetical protein [Bradyrhizobium sp. Leo170]|uniref:hypothetical protein n=1 Tax=Bradyrhizobium sp. Leo170 TaxID=1571199 RepID=UPI0013EE5DD1|nr:hypothetical protein [Bradyrhizobium sp. Leo170]